jgi:RHS repeat-associated protein
MLGNTANTATYNDAGRLKTLTTGTTTTTFIYNALGEMISAKGSATILYVYDQTRHLLGEYSGTGTLIQETVWLGDIPVATLRPSGSSVAIYYVETDQLNTPHAVIVPSNNAFRWDWYTNPFGNAGPAIDPQNLGNFTYDLRYPGQIAGPWGNTFQNDNRDYDPNVGGYVESDPIGLAGGSYSTYSYVGDNPIGFTDSLGLSKTDRWYGYNDRNFQWWLHNCYKRPGDPDVGSREEMAEAYADYLAAGSPPIGKCSNNKKSSCPPQENSEPKPAPTDDNNTDNAAKAVGVGTILYWIISEGSRVLFPPRNAIPVP